uniref:Uncharacterized protein n=1 Tax=Oryza glumipatula TaxID=40148 RepID=A0A0E0B914_9ORYZ
MGRAANREPAGPPPPGEVWHLALWATWKARCFDIASAVVAVHLVDDLSNAKQEARTRYATGDNLKLLSPLRMMDQDLSFLDLKLSSSNLAVGDGPEWDGAAQLKLVLGEQLSAEKLTLKPA